MKSSRPASERLSVFLSRLLRVGPVIVLALLLGACGTALPLFAPAEREDPRRNRLRDPFGRTVAGWTLAQAMGAVPNSQNTETSNNGAGSVPGEIWVTTLDQAPVYAITAGEVAYSGRLERTGNRRLHYVVLRHIGDFVIPATNGVVLTVSGADVISNDYGSFNFGEGPAADQVYRQPIEGQYRFGLAPAFHYEADRVNTLYSVYIGLSNLQVFRGQRVAAGARLGSCSVDPESGYAELQFEIRHPLIKTATNHDAAFRVPLGPSGNGRFQDPQVMADFGYRIPSLVVMSNSDPHAQDMD
ncbi:MAG: hypothetical protein QM296_05785 [Bacillota bacterium]|nr:hypothetical protein [Bacillota bacterium]